MKNKDVCFSHNSDNWRTPSFIYDYFIKMGYKDLFPYNCSYNQYDQLYENEKLFINPPYSGLKNVVDYIIKLYELNNDIYLLIPVRTDTEYFFKLFQHTRFDIYFIKGRLHFNDSKGVAPFPSMLIHFHKFIFTFFSVVESNQLINLLNISI